MRFFIYSQVNSQQISTSMGVPEYSYYFVLTEFLPVLKSLGEVVLVDNPETEVDPLYQQAKAEQVECVFLSFTPPHKTTLRLQCPTIPVFAWEFDSIPTDAWLGQPENNWAFSLRQCGKAITHAELTVTAVQNAVGETFPVAAIPAPVWDKFYSLREKRKRNALRGFYEINILSGILIDSHDVSLSAYKPGLDAVARAVAAARTTVPETTQRPIDPKPAAPDTLPAIGLRAWLWITVRYLVEWYRLVWKDLINPSAGSVTVPTAPLTEALVPTPEPLPAAWLPKAHRLTLSGVIFTAIFNPYDGRKNWVDMLTAYCEAFRDMDDATLVFKLGHHEYHSAMNDMLMCMARLPAFKCRVVLMHGYLDEAAFEALMEATSFVVNASYGEGQCLPLMEFLSSGIPAIAPCHSGMADYISTDIAFVVDSWADATAWPHDPRLAYRTLRHQTDWQSLLQAYKSAYHCFKHMPEKYTALSAAAMERMQQHCSRATAKEKLMSFLNIGDKACCN